VTASFHRATAVHAFSDFLPSRKADALVAEEVSAHLDFRRFLAEFDKVVAAGLGVAVSERTEGRANRLEPAGDEIDEHTPGDLVPVAAAEEQGRLGTASFHGSAAVYAFSDFLPSRKALIPSSLRK
jgi:hypothetical protein